MPMYEYRCSKCGLVFEVRQKFSDPPVTQCRECGAAVEKIISQSGFALKGGGWYDQGYSSSKVTPPSACPQAPSAACRDCAHKVADSA